MTQFAIARHRDGRAVMEGSHACEVRWGTDPKRLRRYDTREEAEGSMRLLCDEDDKACVIEADAWHGRLDAEVGRRSAPCSYRHCMAHMGITCSAGEMRLADCRHWTGSSPAA